MYSAKGKKRVSKTKRKKKSPYTKGELNKLIDSLVHPFCQRDTKFFLLDGVLHAIVEGDPPSSVRKFVKYNLPEIVKQLGEKQQNKSG